MFAEWDWDNWIKPQIDRAVALGLNAIRLIGAARVVFENPTGSSLLKITQDQYDQRWAQVAAYCLVNGLYLYSCIASKWDYTVVSTYQNVTRTAAIKTTAAVLAGFSNVIGFDIFQEGDAFTGVPWKQNTTYPLGYIVNNGGNSYKVTAAGTSASSGAGPSGTSGSVADGSVTWQAQGKALMVADVIALMSAIREVANVPLTMSRSMSDGFGWNDTTSMWYQVFTAPNGADFVDLHIYIDKMLPGDPDFLLLKTGKPFLLGEYGANQSMTSSARAARYNAVAAVHNRRGVIGSFAWGLADQKTSANPEDQWGLFDNTGFVNGSSPLSTSAGKRTTLTDLLPEFTVADRMESAYRPPNILTAIQARPRNVGGSAASGWRIGNNTYIYSEQRGLGYGAVAAGTTLVSTEIGSNPVSPATYYRATVTMLAGTVGRAVAMNVDWYDSSGAYLVSSVSATGTDSPTLPLTLSLVVRSHVNAAYGVLIVRVTDVAQPINEGHIVMDAELVSTA